MTNNKIDHCIENLGQLRAWMVVMEMFTDETPLYPPGENESLQFRLLIEGKGKGTHVVIGRCSDVEGAK